MRIDRLIAAWAISKHTAAIELCRMAEQRDAWKARALEAERIADEAVAKADLYHGWLVDLQTTPEDVPW